MLVPPYDFFGKTDDPGTQGQKLKIEFAIGRDLPARRNVAQTRPIFSHVFQMTMRPRSPETPMIGRRKRREAPTAIVVESLSVRDARDRRVGSRSRPEAHASREKPLRLPLIVHENEIRLVFRAALALLAPDVPPDAGIDRRKTDVAVGLECDFGNGEAVGAAYRLGVELAPASDYDRLCAHCDRPLCRERQGAVERVGDVNARRRKAGIARDHDYLAPGQRTAYRLKGPPPHDERLAHRQRLEAPEVARQPPQQPVAAPDDAVAGNGRDEDEGRRHGPARSTFSPRGRRSCGAAARRNADTRALAQLPPAISLFRRINSLFRGKNSLLRAKKFPVIFTHSIWI